MSDLTADVVVIGGGMAGVSIAAALARDCSVVVVEAETQLAFHSTGRSAAMYLPGYGGPLVRAVTAASRGLYDEASAERDLALLRPRSQLLVAIDEASNVALRQQLSELETLERVDEATALELCPALRPDHVAFAGLDTTGMEIDVDGLHQAYLARLRRAGGTVLRQAPVEAVTRRGAGWEVAAGARRIATATVVDAAGAWADRVAALAGVPGIGLVPKRRTAFISPVAEPFPGLADSPMVVDGMERWYFKPEAGGLLVSPADETPVDPHDARPTAGPACAPSWPTGRPWSAPGPTTPGSSSSPVRAATASRWLRPWPRSAPRCCCTVHWPRSRPVRTWPAVSSPPPRWARPASIRSRGDVGGGGRSPVDYPVTGDGSDPCAQLVAAPASSAPRRRIPSSMSTGCARL
jgi:D-arginine dehydrogenase